jgi:hypothetical protein
MCRKDLGRHETPEVSECYRGPYHTASEYEMRVTIAAVLQFNGEIFQFAQIFIF